MSERALERASRKVSAWLRGSDLTEVRSLSAHYLQQTFTGRDIAHGWSFQVTLSGSPRELRLLLGAAFPYDRARVALGSPAEFLTWPHVESDGMLCMRHFDFDANDPVANAKNALALAFDLIEGSPDAATQQEFEREFVSYWSQATAQSTKPLVTIFDPAGDARGLRAWAGTRFTVVADQKGKLERWLEHQGHEVTGKFDFGLFLPIKAPPTPPYPSDPEALVAWCAQNGDAGTVELLRDPLIKGDELHIVMRAEVSGQAGLVGVTISQTAQGSKKHARRRVISLPALADGGKLTTRKVQRGDPAWVHGRAQNSALPALSAATVAVFGCGALGSHIAVRLAQAGVGSFVLVDPEVLVTANVGRHALGMASVQAGKASALARHLKFRFPHLRSADAIGKNWQDAAPESIFGVTAIVSAIGEGGPELLLNEEHLARGANPPIVYGWMEARGAAAHAVAIVRSNNCLRCVLDGDGWMKSPETAWLTTPEVLSEPACGTLFQPFGPTEVARAEALVSDVAVDVLRGRIREANVHRVYTTSTDRLTEVQGSWTDTHLQVRPPGWTGALEFERPLPDAGACDAKLH